MTPLALTVAGSDSGAGAGIQADLKTFAARGVYGASVITALTAQNTRGVEAVHVPPASFLAAQLDAVLADFEVCAIKIGMMAEAELIEALAERLAARAAQVPLVLDPVMVAKSGDRLLAETAIERLRDVLLPRASLVTPNLPEAAVLLDWPSERVAAQPQQAGAALLEFGCEAVLLKGGHAGGAESVDWLFLRDAASEPVRYASRRLETKNTHGTGCTLSAAIAASLARGLGMRAAIDEAKDYVTRAIEAAQKLRIGQGSGPLHHFHAWWPSEPS